VAQQLPAGRAADEAQPTHLGGWEGWGVTHSPSIVAPTASLRAPRALWLFDGGEPCWEGPPRSTRVELRCGAEDALLAADEDGKCAHLVKGM
tara:strand:- start:203 stop:478 length:276 start_codon:yes stop_codon:yes gene_type:complete